MRGKFCIRSAEPDEAAPLLRGLHSSEVPAERTYHLKPGKVGRRIIGAYKTTEQAFAEAFLQEDAGSPSGYRLKTGRTGQAVTGVYHTIEDGVVGTYRKIENAFVDRFLEKTDGSENKQ